MCQNLSTNQFALREGADTHSVWRQSAQLFVRDVERAKKFEKSASTTHTHTLNVFFYFFFHLLNSPAAVSLKFFNNSVLEDMIQEGSLCLSQAWLPLAPCSIIVIHTTPNAPSQIIRRFIKGMGRYHSLWSFAIQIFYFFFHAKRIFFIYSLTFYYLFSHFLQGSSH